MKTTTFTKKDIIATVACIVFLLLTGAAVGPRGRRHAKDMLCISNLQKWGSVCLAFAADNDGLFMPGWYPDYVKNGDMWMDALRPYYGNNHKLRCCPEATIPGSQVQPDSYAGGLGTFVAWGAFPGECGQPSTWWSPATGCDYGSYGYNGFLHNPPPEVYYVFGRPTTWSWRTPNVTGAADIPLMSGSQWIDQWPTASDQVPEYDGQPWGPSSSYSSMVRVCINRHEGSINSAFLDASARKVPLKCLWKLRWHRFYNPYHGPTEEEFNSAGNGWMAEFPPCQSNI
ncbi:MAG: hypothetical protein JSV99_00770 [Planctomycetota bacterium]|nr:MAG: hypothetical protein JSV99_00770 [Planctomycetota bacterium]